MTSYTPSTILPRCTTGSRPVGERRIAADFAVADALRLERLGRKFDTVLDCGLFHTFDAEERPRYVTSLASATKNDGTLYVLCFSDEGSDIGPHPVGRQELSEAFGRAGGWSPVDVEATPIQTPFHGVDGAPGWLATVKRA